MLRKLRTARKLSRAEWGLFLQAWVLLLVVDWALRLLPFRRVQSLFVSRRAAHSHNINDPEAMIHFVAAQVDRATRNHLYPMRCLRRSLAIQSLLARRGISTELHFGVRKEEGQLNAHAWLEYEGQIVVEPVIISERFIPLDVMENHS
jgi:hypothetical protein